MENKKNLREKAHLFLQTALKTWAHIGYDYNHGGYVEALSFNGKPLLERNKRFRIHGRNIFSHAAGTVWGYYDGLSAAENAVNFITEKCKLTNGGYVSTTAADGTHVDVHQRTYEHAFTLLGLGWLSYATKKPEHIRLLNDTWNFIDTNLRHEHGGFIVSIPSDGTPYQQNPHMHMFEALLNLYEIFQDDRWIQEAEKIYALFQDHFFTKDNILLEFFTENWQPHPQKGAFIDPGHHYEWTWLLRKYEKLTGKCADVIPLLYDFALAFGTDKHGLGYDEMYKDKTIYRDTHRLWVQTEALKAHLVMSERVPEKSKEMYLLRADAILQIMFDKYFIEELGIWHDQLNSCLVNISQDAPASTLYHVVIALHEYLQIRK